MIVCGRVINIKKKKNNIFIMVQENDLFQIVVKMDKINREINNLKIGDIIECNVKKDLNNNSKYKCEYKSYLLITLTVISKNKKDFKLNVDKEKIFYYSEVKYNVRKYLHDKGYMEIDIPVLTDGEISSKSRSFSTNYFKTKKKLFLRKTLDIFLRMYSCSDFNKIYSIGSCFRNEYLTSMDKPEFEMLSIFSNYASKKEAEKLALRILKIIVKDDMKTVHIDNDEYKKITPLEDVFYIISKYSNDKNSYCCDINGVDSDEFRIKYKGVTIVHGVNEIYNYEEYIRKIESQGKKKNYGELKILENLINSGAPKCYNLGISIVRVLCLYNNLKIKDYDTFSFDRLGG